MVERTLGSHNRARDDARQGNVAGGYFTYPSGEVTWLDPRWRDDPFQVHWGPQGENVADIEIDRRIRIVAMGC